MTRKVGSFEDFKVLTLAVARGKRNVSAGEPKIWYESMDRSARRNTGVHFRSLEAGAKLLSAKNRALLRMIAKRKPRSVSELAAMTDRAQQNVLRTLTKLVAAGIVRLDKGEGRAKRPKLVAHKVHIEINLLR